MVEDEVREERVTLELRSDASAPGTARREASRSLARWRLQPLLDPVLLTVSELVTNAVRYGRAPLRLSLRRCRTGLAVGVHDAAPVHTAVGALPGDDAESGRGLFLVQACADETGVRAEDDGKVVWARFDGPVAERP